MKIKKDWHPIFWFLFELFKDLPPHFKYFYHPEMKLVIGINSYLEDQGKMNIVFESKVKLEYQDNLEPGEISEIKEEWWLNFKDGSCSCEQEVAFKSFTGYATKTAEGKGGPYLPEEYKNWVWIKSQLDSVLKIIQESKRINPYTGKILTPEKAKEFDKKMSGRIGRVEDFGAKVEEALRKNKKGR
jgi:hypothetical protein